MDQPEEKNSLSSSAEDEKKKSEEGKNMDTSQSPENSSLALKDSEEPDTHEEGKDTPEPSCEEWVVLEAPKDYEEQANEDPGNGCLNRGKVFWICNGDTFGAHEAIMERVKNISWIQCLFFSTIEEVEKPEDSCAIIVFCPITSRFGSDVESAMTDQRVSVNKPVILVLMHHTRDVNYSTSGRKCSEEYGNIVLEVHVLFHETKPGLLNCPHNDQVIESIKEKLVSYHRRRT